MQVNMNHTDEPVVVEQTFQVSREKLWNAITQKSQMTQWFFDNIEEFEPKTGFETRFVVENEGRVFPHLWKITDVVPFESITYNWRYEGYTGNSFVTFKITGQDKVSHLTLTHIITENFPDDIPEFRRESCISGWDWFIRQGLKNYLEKG
jgi:uncharacterized protein YndB with AHSA1/START domain